MSYDDDIILVHKNLTEQLSPEKVDNFKQWKESRSENSILADQIKNIWDSAAETTEIAVDVDKAYHKHIARMKSDIKANSSPLVNADLDSQNIKSPSQTKLINLNWFRSFAALFVISIAVILIFKNKEEYNNINTNQKLVLSDGSSVWIQKGSLLNTNSFSPNNRNVKLQGKGYFEIKSNSEAPFKIDANGIEILVLGTKFIVNTESREINVKDGKVKVSYNQENIIVVANQKVSISHNGQIKVENMDFDPSQLWFNEELKFNNAPFDQVIKDISENYNVKFTLPTRNDWSNCTFTSGALKGNTLEEILLILKLTYDLEYTKTKDNNIVLSKVKCK